MKIVASAIGLLVITAATIVDPPAAARTITIGPTESVAPVLPVTSLPSLPSLPMVDLAQVQGSVQESAVIADQVVAQKIEPDYSVFTDYNVVHLVWASHGVVDPYVHWQMDCIINLESHWNRYARSRTGDSGLFQVNDIHKWRWAWEAGYLDIFDPWINAEVAFQIYKDAGYSFRPWSVRYRCS